MQTEVIVALIALIGTTITVIVPVLHKQKTGKNEKLNKESEEKIKRNEMKKKVNQAFNAREDLYNELTLCTARYALYNTENGKEEMARLVEECREARDRYAKINQEAIQEVFIDEE